MVEEKKEAKGGFRATLALIISLIALVLSIIAFNRTGGQPDLNAEIIRLQTKLQELKKETSEQVSKVSEETKKTIEKIAKSIKKE